MSWSTRMGATKFTFDTVFQERDDVVSDAARARRRLSLTQGELDAMLALARHDGLSAGEVRAMESLASAARDVIDVIGAALSRTKTDIEAVREQAAEIALAAARKLARAAVQSFAAGEVEAALREAMHQAIGEPRIVLRAAPGIAQALQARIAEIAHDEGYDGRVQISPEASIHNADCRIEWRGGGAERSEAAIDAALCALIARRFQDAERPTTEA
jgi:flagellar assembly protein FliH